jgi:hypothetical protein
LLEPSRGDFASMMAWKSDDKDKDHKDKEKEKHHSKGGEKAGGEKVGADKLTSDCGVISGDDAYIVADGTSGILLLSSGEHHVFDRTSWRMGLEAVEEDSADDANEVRGDRDISIFQFFFFFTTFGLLQFNIFFFFFELKNLLM